MSQVKNEPDPRILVGFEKADDAGVYVLSGENVLVQTIDFFTPVVDDPRVYGQIAAANALSDVYAMGAKPLVALSIIAFPAGVVDEADLVKVVRGGTDKMREAEVPVIGGHSVRDPEMKFGYAVTGTARAPEIVANDGARPGDILILTKPLGTGIITTGIKFGKTPEDVANTAVEWMCRLNDAGLGLKESGANAATDITGYGLIGHAYEIARASQVTLSFDNQRIPVIEGTLELARQGNLPGGIESNRTYVGNEVVWHAIDELTQKILLDPQTSGGLLVSLPADKADRFVARLESKGSSAWRIGEVLSYEGTHIQVR